MTCPASPIPGRATLCVPMHASYGQIGVVHLVAPEGAELSSIPRELAETLVRLLAPALENARLLRESIERSTTDPLTGLANRRRLEEFASKQIALSLRQQTPLAVVLLDLDRFKAINDEYGHDAGDRALVAVAAALRSAIRETDLAARVGGDEFALLLPGSSAGAAVSVVERVRTPLSMPAATGLPCPLELSAGITELSTRGATLSELISLADRALYEAKREGRTAEQEA